MDERLNRVELVDELHEGVVAHDGGDDAALEIAGHEVVDVGAEDGGEAQRGEVHRGVFFGKGDDVFFGFDLVAEKAAAGVSAKKMAL